MAARPSVRPVSPHLSIWKWRVNMTVSILHRATGSALATAGVTMFLWWLIAAATGASAYLAFYKVATGWFGILVGVGLTWALFQHMMSGIRHLVMDTGRALAVDTSRKTATATLLLSSLLTLLTWAAIFTARGL